jgi:hypothetical protein
MIERINFYCLMNKQGQGIGEAFKSDPGRLKTVELVPTVFVQDVEKNLNPFPLRVNLWTTVKELKSKISKTTGYPVQRQRLFFNNNELDNQKTLDTYNILNRKNVIVLRLKPDIDTQASYMDVYGAVYCHKKMSKVIEMVRQGFNSGLIPKLT